MPRIEVNASELATLKQALETFNDMNNDMLLEDMPVNLYPRGDQKVTFDVIQAIALREKIEESFNKMMNIRSLLHKVGSKVNDKGYSV